MIVRNRWKKIELVSFDGVCIYTSVGLNEFDPKVWGFYMTFFLLYVQVKKGWINAGIFSDFVFSTVIPTK